MGTEIRVQFNREKATPEAWETLLTALQSIGDLHPDACDEYAEVIVRGGYGYCNDFPNVEDVPKTPGATWAKWYLERDADDEGAWGDE